MSNLALATSLLVLCGAALTSVGVLRGRKISGFVPPELRRRWRMMITLMLFFLAGYLCLVLILVKRVFIVINLTGNTIVRMF
jgi:hypothetical protein